MSGPPTSWGDRWRAVLSGGPDMARRVRQGKATYRSGRVSDVRLATGRVSARVQGARATPFLVEVEVPLLGDEAWEVLTDLLASKVRYSARLLAGHHPEGLDDEAAQQGVSLFPRLEEISVAAGHSGEDPFPVAGAALWEAVAVRLDTSPFPLLKLRGRGRERVLRDVSRRRRAGQGTGPQGVPVQEVDVLGWSAERAPLGAVAVPRVRTPRMDAPTLHVLGDPEGWAGALSAADMFGPMVAGAAARAREVLARADGGPVGEEHAEEA